MHTTQRNEEFFQLNLINSMLKGLVFNTIKSLVIITRDITM